MLCAITLPNLCFGSQYRNRYEHANIEEEKINSTSFLFEIQNPSCFLFPVIFVGMHVVEHFSRRKMQIQVGIALKTQRVLEPNPWKAAKFSLSLWCTDGPGLPTLQLHCSRMSAKKFAQRNLCDKQRFCDEPNCKAIRQKLESFCLDLLKQPPYFKSHV